MSISQLTEDACTCAMPDAPLQIRSIGKGWLWINNAVYDRYATQLGIEGLGLYVALARYANNKTAQCWPSLSRLATEMGTEVAVLEQALDRLTAAGLLHRSQQPGKGTVLTLLAPPPEVPAAPAVCPLPPTPIVSRTCEDVREQNPEEKKTFVSLSSPPQKQHKEQTRVREMDETSSWSQPPVTFGSVVRPDEALAAAQLSPEDYATFYAEVKGLLMAEGVKEFCLTTPVIEAKMSLILDQQVRVQVQDGCLHEHVDTANVCNDCGEVLTLDASTP